MANYDLTYEGSRVQNILDTGDELRDAGYIFRGEATPSTVPGTPTERVAYIGGPGTYTNFGSSITVGAGCICVFKYTGSAWSNQVINTGLSDAISSAINSEATTRSEADTALQNAITAINNNIGNGYVYVGVATPSTSPVTGKVFYLAVTAGTYTNFEDSEETPLAVTAGINILKNTGTGWVLDQVIAIDAEPTQGSANLVKSGGVLNSIIQNGPAFDLSAYNAQGGVLATYADLNAALTALNALPADFKKGGMSMKFVLSSDNKYIQYFLTKDEWSVDTRDWEKVNLQKEVEQINQQLTGINITSDGSGVTSYIFKAGTTYHIKNNNNSYVTISHRNTPTGTSEDSVTIDALQEIDYTPTTNGLYLRYGSACNLTIIEKGSVYDLIISGYLYKGIATPSTSPDTAFAKKIFYLATAAGTYTNFEGLVTSKGINILKYDGTSWSKEILTSIDNILDNNSLVSLYNLNSAIRKSSSGKDLVLGIGSISTGNGTDTDANNRIRTEIYLRDYFSITLSSGYTILNVYKYVVGVNGLVYDTYEIVDANSFTSSEVGYYRVVISKNTAGAITEQDINSCIQSYTVNIEDSIYTNDVKSNNYSDVSFTIVEDSYYDSNGDIQEREGLARTEIDLNSSFIKVKFYYGVSSYAKMGFVVDNTFVPITYNSSEKLPGTSCYLLEREIPEGATKLCVSWAISNLTVSQNIQVIVTLDKILNDLKNQLSNIDNEKLDKDDSISLKEYTIDSIIAEYGIDGFNLSDGEDNGNSTYRHLILNLKNQFIKQIKLDATNTGSTSATYGFIVNGVWQGTREIVSSTSIIEKVVDVPDGATEFRYAWNYNAIKEDFHTIKAYGYKELYEIIKDNSKADFQKMDILNPFNPVCDLSKVPSMTAPTEQVIFNTQLADFYAMYDALVTAYPNYITKVDCDDYIAARPSLGIIRPSYLEGLPIYMYKLIPTIGKADVNPYDDVFGERPRVLLTSMHPQEKFGDFTLYNTVKMICEDWANNPDSELCRSFVDIYVIPFAWPWNYANSSRTTINGINANRQFPTKNWTESGQGTVDYTGPEPLYEYEAKLLDYFVKNIIKPDVVIDVHTSGQTSSGVMGIILYNKYDKDLNRVVSSICRTTSNRAIADNTNYPQNDPDHIIYRPYPTDVSEYGEFFEYCYELGIKYSILSEESPYSKWDNGEYNIDWPKKEEYTNGILRQQVQYIFNTLLRLTKSVYGDIEGYRRMKKI